MAREKVDKLFVNLSASQTRKRLKGHGLGVKRVESAGRNRAVICHTATGQHLRELRALLSDVACSTSDDDLGMPVENLRNLGPTSAAWLREIGVDTQADLKQLGPVLAYRLVKRHRPHVSLNLLWALAGAVCDRDWRELSTDEKQELLTQAAD